MGIVRPGASIPLKIWELLECRRNYNQRQKNGLYGCIVITDRVLETNMKFLVTMVSLINSGDPSGKLLHLDDWVSSKEIATPISQKYKMTLSLYLIFIGPRTRLAYFCDTVKEREKLQQFLAKNGVIHYPIVKLPFKQKAYENLSVANQN